MHCVQSLVEESTVQEILGNVKSKDLLQKNPEYPMFLISYVSYIYATMLQIYVYIF